MTAAVLYALVPQGTTDESIWTFAGAAAPLCMQGVAAWAVNHPRVVAHRVTFAVFTAACGGVAHGTVMALWHAVHFKLPPMITTQIALKTWRDSASPC